jgi:hypothetical protein
MGEKRFSIFGIRFFVSSSCTILLLIAGQLSGLYALNAPFLSKVAALDSNRILLSWSPQTNIKGFYLLVKSGPSEFACVDTLPGDASSFFDSSVN